MRIPKELVYVPHSLGVKGAVAHFGICERTLRYLVSKREIPHHRIGKRKILIEVQEVKKYLAKHRVPSKEEILRT